MSTLNTSNRLELFEYLVESKLFIRVAQLWKVARRWNRVNYGQIDDIEDAARRWELGGQASETQRPGRFIASLQWDNSVANLVETTTQCTAVEFI